MAGLEPRAFSELLAARSTVWSLNKYYVDEIYYAAVFNPYLVLSARCAGFDAHIIDGIVNLAPTLTMLVPGCPACSTTTWSTAW